MAESIWAENPGDGDLNGAHAALKKECGELAHNTIYTSTSFYIWLRWLKTIRSIIWIAAVICSTAAASAAISKKPDLEIMIAAFSLLGVILPGVMKALKLDETISSYEETAAAFKKAEGRLRRAANVWSNETFDEFKQKASIAISDLEEAQKASLTPPEFCFKAAQRKVQSGDYEPDS